MVGPYLKSLEISNFKSFDYLKINFGNLNVIVGANASGKSNFVNIFRFLKDASLYGLEDAFVMNGGVESIQNMRISPEKQDNLTIKLQISLSPEESINKNMIWAELSGERQALIALSRQIDYSFTINYFKNKSGYRINEESVDIRVGFFERRDKKNFTEELGKELLEGNIRFKIDATGKFHFNTEPSSLKIDAESIFPLRLASDKSEDKFKSLIVKNRRELMFCYTLFRQNRKNSEGVKFFSTFTQSIFQTFNNFGIYDIDPRLSKKSMLTVGKAELSPDGSNLPAVLYDILSHNKNRRRLANLLNDVLPFIDDVSVEKLSDRSFLTCLREKGFEMRYLPAPFISDGTVNIIAIIIALYFEKNSIAIFEEPERNIHPKLLLKIMDMMKDVSSRLNKQLIITTHNPTVVKSAGVDNLLLISRKDGFSQVSRPSEVESVNAFLKQEIGLDDLFIKNLLGP